MGSTRIAEGPGTRRASPGQAGEEPAACFELASDMQALPPLPDWDELMAKGVVPALILGAERRLRR